MAENRVFDPSVRENLNALVSIARYPDAPLVKQAIENGHYGAVNLEQVQYTLLSLRTTYPQLGIGLSLSQGYNPTTFEALINQFRAVRTANQRLLLDVVNEAIERNDPSLLEHFPAKLPSKIHPENIPLSPPSQQSIPELQIPNSPTTSSDTPSFNQNKKEPKIIHVVNPEKPEKSENQQKPNTENSQSETETQQQEQAQSDNQDNRNNQTNNRRGDNRLKKKLNERLRNSRAGRAVRNRLDSLSERTGLNRVNNFLNRLNSPFRALNNAINRFNNWLGNRTGYSYINRLGNRIGNWAGRTTSDLTSKGLRALLRLGSSLARLLAGTAIRTLSGLASSSAARAGASAGRSAAVGVGRALGYLLLNPVTWMVIGVAALFIFIWWYNNQIANSECAKPLGEMKVDKRISNSLDPNDPSINNDDKQIRFVIEMSYELLCQDRKLQQVTVIDKIPEGTSYDASNPSAKSGFRNDDSTGPEGVFDPATNTLTWTFNNFPTLSPVFIYYNLERETTDAWIINEAIVKYSVSGPTGGKIINSGSQTFEQVVVGAAQNADMPPAVLKAILSVEAPKVLEYSEPEFLNFSQPGWWEGLVADAPTLEQNDPAVIRGYAYNTCAYSGSCGAGNDVRGVAQFLLETWESIAQKLQFTDNHTPDRRNATDAIFGSALYNRQNAEIYTGNSNVIWDEATIRAMARMYCAGPGAANNPAAIRNKACGWDGTYGYDDFVWRNYQIYLGTP